MAGSVSRLTMNRKECLLQWLREALVGALTESPDAVALMTELVGMGCLPQIELKVLEQHASTPIRLSEEAYDQDFLRRMRIAVE